jgi:hypothetical protein
MISTTQARRCIWPNPGLQDPRAYVAGFLAESPKKWQRQINYLGQIPPMATQFCAAMLGLIAAIFLTESLQKGMDGPG